MNNKRIGRLGGQRWDNRTYYDHLSVNADQVEWQAILHGSAHVMAGTMDDEMAEQADQEIDEEIRTTDLMEGKSRVLESAQGQTTEIIFDRISQLGDSYPFIHIENSLHYKDLADRVPMYELMLGISRAPSLTTGEYVKLPRVFEQISKLAGMAFLGPSALGLHTGWPRLGSIKRFKDLINQIREETGKFSSEWEWTPGSDLPSDPVPSLIKDGGMDVVAWRPWADKRGAHLYLLGQCACGGDWLNKANDLNLSRLNEWCKPTRVPPVRGFFTPHYAVKAILHEQSLSAGLMFDRVRIVHMLQEPHIREHVLVLLEEIKNALAIAKGQGKNPLESLKKADSKNKSTKAIAMPGRRPAN